MKRSTPGGPEPVKKMGGRFPEFRVPSAARRRVANWDARRVMTKPQRGAELGSRNRRSDLHAPRNGCEKNESLQMPSSLLRAIHRLKFQPWFGNVADSLMRWREV